MAQVSLLAGLSSSLATARDWDRRRVAVAILYLASYVLLDWLSYVQPVIKLGITPWNPQAGLTLAFLLIYGPRWAVATALAVILSEALIRNASPASPLVLCASAWIALGYGGLAALLRQWDLAAPIRTPEAAARLAGASVGATLLIAAGFLVLFLSAGELSSEHALATLPRLWIGDLTGILTLTPLLIYMSEWRRAGHVLRSHPWETLAQLLAIAAALWLGFGLTATDQLRFFYPLFVPVIWIALRWGLPGGMLAALAIQIGVLVGAQDQGRSPPLVDLQFLMLTLSLTALLLGAVVTERARVLQRIAMQEAEQRALLAMSPDGILAVDTRGTVRMANPAALRLFGDGAGASGVSRLSDLLPGLQLHADEGRAGLDGRRAAGGSFPAEIAWARLDSPANEGFLVTVRDATDRHRAEARLRERDTALARAMRFAVAGELASALAHELNQPITAIVSYLQASEILAAPIVSQDERLSATLGKAAREAIRASEVLRRLRDFYRGGALKREPVQLSALCSATVVTFQDRLRRANVSLTTRLDSALPTFEADVAQLEIALHNLLTNAIDALIHVSERSRRIEVHAQRIDDAIVIRVEDSGPGIAPDIAQRLFDPFMTSKPDGMGLGLAISRSLIRARGGDLWFEPSEKLGGACFIVRIPVEMPTDEFHD
jgi:signal transduction histidine kinase